MAITITFYLRLKGKSSLIMNKYLLLIILPLLSFVVAGCGDSDDEENLFFAPDPCLIPGT